MDAEQPSVSPDDLSGRLLALVRAAEEITERTSLPVILNDLAILGQLVAASQHAAVLAAREQGLSWEQIGAPMGLTAQVARTRFDDE